MCTHYYACRWAQPLEWLKWSYHRWEWILFIRNQVFPWIINSNKSHFMLTIQMEWGSDNNILIIFQRSSFSPTNKNISKYYFVMLILLVFYRIMATNTMSYLILCQSKWGIKSIECNMFLAAPYYNESMKSKTASRLMGLI